VAREDQPPFFAEVAETVASFFRKPGVWYGIAYILFYRFAEGQLTKIASPFLLDDRANGGLGLSVAANGTIYGTAGVAMLVVGGILGGIAVSRGGLGRWILWMALAINLPNLVYVWMAFVQPESLWLVALCVGIEQLGYGFGFAGYMLYMISLAQGKHQTAHYALCTGIMAAGMMLPGFISGDIQEALGYRWFFVWIMVSTIPSFIVTWLLPVDPDFGREEAGDAV
jgi:PAT family beta-lactamase induction signal transducer AmpG